MSRKLKNNTFYRLNYTIKSFQFWHWMWIEDASQKSGLPKPVIVCMTPRISVRQKTFYKSDLWNFELFNYIFDWHQIKIDANSMIFLDGAWRCYTKNPKIYISATKRMQTHSIPLIIPAGSNFCVRALGYIPNIPPTPNNLSNHQSGNTGYCVNGKCQQWRLIPEVLLNS